MFDSHRTPLLVVLSILVLVSLPSAARSQTSDPPPWSDTIDAMSEFLVCEANPYALCYFSGPNSAPTNGVPALPCVLQGDGHHAQCRCYLINEDTSTTLENFVAIKSILNDKVRQRTIYICGEKGTDCRNMKNVYDICQGGYTTQKPCLRAPVCHHLGDAKLQIGQTLYKDQDVIYISTFSGVKRNDYNTTEPTTPCSKQQYAGCMTAPCGAEYTVEDNSGNDVQVVDCKCPTFPGVYQIPTVSDPPPSCDLGDTNVWSASNSTF